MSSRPRRIIALTSDGAVRERLAAALAETDGSVEGHHTLASLGEGAIDAAVCVLHLAGEIAQAAPALLPRLATGCRVLAIVPGADLAQIVALMQLSSHVAAVMAEEDLDPRELAAVIQRLVSGDLFGLAKVAGPRAQVQSERVRTYEERTQCLHHVAEAIAAAGVPERLRAPIEQCLDELVMNALYAAPVDRRGRPVFAEISPQARAQLALDAAVTVEHACDGRRFAFAVRDGFGTLTRDTVLRLLHKGLHAADKIDRKTAGAGVGLYLTASSASTLYFHVVPGVATEVVCAFDLQAPAPRLGRFDFCVEPTEVTGQLVPAKRPARPFRPRVPGRGRRVAVIGASAAVVGVAAALAYPHVFGTRAAEAARVPTVEIDSTPSGAQAELDGKPLGGTPVALTTLAPGASATIVLHARGYRDATVHVEAPAAGETKRVVQPLERSPDYVLVHFASTPPGARVVAIPTPPGVDRTYTPADVFVEAGKEQRFRLTMPQHAAVDLPPFTPARGSGPLEESGTLAPVATGP